MASTTTLSDRDYQALARFRHALRVFQRFSEDAARRAGTTPAQHQLLLAIRGHRGDRPPVVGDIAGAQLRHHSVVELIDRRGGRSRRRTADRRTSGEQYASPTPAASCSEALSKTHRDELPSRAEMFDVLREWTELRRAPRPNVFAMANPIPRVEPVTNVLGATVTGFDLRETLDDETVAELADAWVEHKVLFLPDQPIDREGHKRFARYFGEIYRHPYLKDTKGDPDFVRLYSGGDTGTALRRRGLAHRRDVHARTTDGIHPPFDRSAGVRRRHDVDRPRSRLLGPVAEDAGGRVVVDRDPQRAACRLPPR
jgi:hypothetical protein